MRGINTLLTLSILCFTTGCSMMPEPPTSGEAQMALMGDSAPMIGDKDTATLDKFVVGSWKTMNGMDPDQAKQMGLSAMGGYEEGNEYFTFKADGTLTVTSKGKSFVVGG